MPFQKLYWNWWKFKNSDGVLKRKLFFFRSCFYHVGDLKLVTRGRFWRRNFNVIDIIGRLGPAAIDKRWETYVPIIMSSGWKVRQGGSSVISQQMGFLEKFHNKLEQFHSIFVKIIRLFFKFLIIFLTIYDPSPKFFGNFSQQSGKVSQRQFAVKWQVTGKEEMNKSKRLFSFWNFHRDMLDSQLRKCQFNVRYLWYQREQI